MTRNWKKTGYLIPETIEPEENICVCVPIPKDWGHVNAFLGQITDLAKWLTWEKTGGDEAIRSARRWMEITECVMKEVNRQMSSNCGCGCGGGGGGTAARQRISSTGHIEVSNDGGLTWENDDANDPRFNSVVFPPISGEDGDAKRCKGANSIVTWLSEAQSEASAVLGVAGGVAGLIAAAASAFAGVGVTIVPAIILAILAAILNIIANAGQEVFDDSFEGSFWDQVLCIVYCEMSDDASFTEAAWQSVINKVAAIDDAYPAAEWTAYMIKTAGLVALTNAARSGKIGSRSCAGCECVPACENPARFTLGTVINQGVDGEGNTYFDVESAPNGVDGADTIIWGVLGDLDATCCTWYNTTILEGSCTGSLGRYITPTNTTDQTPFESAAPAENISAFAVQQNGCLFGNPFTARLTLSACTLEE